MVGLWLCQHLRTKWYCHQKVLPPTVFISHKFGSLVSVSVGVGRCRCQLQQNISLFHTLAYGLNIYLLNKIIIIIILQPFQQRLSLSNNKPIIYVYQESHRTASNSDLASSSCSKLRHVCRHHHHSVLITSQAREK